MGYHTEFYGHFDISPALPPEKIKELNDFCEQYHNEDEQRRLGIKFSYNCDWQFSEDGTKMAWNGCEKSYEMLQWANVLLKRMPGHELAGTIRADGEEYGDVWLMVAEGRKVVRKPCPPDAEHDA